jgi:hypothetical protein
MGSAIVVRYETTVESAAENQRLVEQVYTELAGEQPDGLRYMTLRLADGVTFVHIAFRDPAANPLSQSKAFHEFQADLGQRVTAPPQSSEATVVGAYGF